MNFCILFALACMCQVAVSHKRYIAIPRSALRNGRADSERGTIVFDVNPLQVTNPRSVGISRRAGSSSTRALGRSSGERTARGSSISARRGATAIEAIQRQLDLIRGTSAISNRRATPTGSIQRVVQRPSQRQANIIASIPGRPTRRASFIARIAPSSRGRHGNYVTYAPTVTYLPSVSSTYVGGNVGYINTMSPSYTVVSANQPGIVSGLSYEPTLNAGGHFAQRPRYLSYISNTPSFRSIF